MPSEDLRNITTFEYKNACFASFSTNLHQFSAAGIPDFDTFFEKMDTKNW
jgi:hypothetical protein